MEPFSNLYLVVLPTTILFWHSQVIFMSKPYLTTTLTIQRWQISKRSYKSFLSYMTVLGDKRYHPAHVILEGNNKQHIYILSYNLEDLLSPLCLGCVLLIAFYKISFLWDNHQSSILINGKLKYYAKVCSFIVCSPDFSIITW